MSAVADTVIPSYEGKVEFVNALTSEPSGQQLAAQFSFQYIPTSFFLKADGTVSDSVTGPIDETEMRRRLDELVSQ